MPADLEIIVIGSEILQGRCGESNSRRIAAELAAIGVEPSRVTILPDDVRAIASEISRGVERSGILIVTGGLGPTHDDLTRSAVIEALGGDTEEREEFREAIENGYRRFGKKPPRGYSGHSIVPRGARMLSNPVGIAPGLEVRREGVVLYVLPGVPAEMREMLRASVLPALAGRERGRALLLRTFGLNESEVEERLRPVLEPEELERLSIVSGISGVDCYMRAGSWDERTRREMAAALGTALYTDSAKSMEEICVEGLKERGATLAAAESVTGGLIASRLVSVPGASESFLEGLVTYSDASKIARLGIAADVLARDGAVSEATCVGMAEGVMSTARSDIGLSTTGIAGPGGATVEKPVGLCFVGLALRGRSYCARRVLPGDRNTIRERAASIALDLLRLELQGEEETLRSLEVFRGNNTRRER